MFDIDFSLVSGKELHKFSSEKLAGQTEPWELEVWEFISRFTDSTADDIEVTTSGSTGAPKKIRLLKQSMLNSAEATCTALALKRGDSALLCLPANKIGGMMMIVRSIYQGLHLFCLRPSVTPLSSLPDNVPINFAAFTPMQLDEILHSTTAFEKSSKIDNIILGGQDLGGGLSKLIQTMPNNIYHTFGMTETISHIALKKLSGNNPDNFYTTIPGVTIQEDSYNCLIINAKNINVFKLTSTDIVHVISPSQFEWIGRIDNVINSGGVKIYPEEIERKLLPFLDTPFFVTGLPDVKSGAKLVLIIEAAVLAETDKTRLLGGFSELDRFSTPKEILLSDKFYRTENGKIRRKESLQHITGTLKLS